MTIKSNNPPQKPPLKEEMPSPEIRDRRFNTPLPPPTKKS